MIAGQKNKTGHKTRVFVYGNLLSGEPEDHQLEDSEFIGYGTLRGAYTMFNVGGNFPAVVEVDGPEREIVGEVYEVDMGTLYQSLDHLEDVDKRDPENRKGEGRGNYYRREVEVEGDAVKVWVYLMTAKRCGRVGFHPLGLLARAERRLRGRSDEQG